MKKNKKIATVDKKKIVIISSITISAAILVTVLFLVVMPLIRYNTQNNRVTSIFDSLGIDGQKYMLTNGGQSSDISALCKLDTGVQYSFIRNYIRGANVDVTVAELKQLIARTEFKPYKEMTDGDANVYTYKSLKNEYLRFSVLSKFMEDNYWNKWYMGLSTDGSDLDSNVGPSNVHIDISFDGNK